MRLKKFAAGAVLLLVLSLALVACGDSTPTTGPAAAGPTAGATPAKGKQAVKLALSYIPNVQFAPYYVAKDKGYFEAEGLDVTFDYSTVETLLTLVGQGTIPFALAGGDEVLQARAGSIPVVYIATQYQKYPVALAAPKGKGITKPADLKGKTVGIPGQFGSTYVGLKAVLAAGKLSEEDVKVQTIGFTQREALSQGKVDAAMVYSMNEPVQLQQAGIALDTVEVSSLISLASIGLVTSEKLITTQPELVQKMVRAVSRGIKDTIASPEAAFDSTGRVAPDAKGDNPALQLLVLKETVKFMTADNVKEQPIGYSDPKVWEASQQFLLDNKLIRARVETKDAFTNKFVTGADAGKY